MLYLASTYLNVVVHFVEFRCFLLCKHWFLILLSCLFYFQAKAKSHQKAQEKAHH